MNGCHSEDEGAVSMFEQNVDSKSPIPLYLQLRDIFDNKIVSGEWVSGQMIPTENELIQKYQVSRTTVREAITSLVNEGKLEKKQGRGTSVCKPKLVERLSRLTGFTEEMLQRGMTPGSIVLDVEEMEPPATVKDKLFEGQVGRVLFVKRIRLANGEPIAIERSYWPLQIGHLFRNADLANVAFYDILDQHGIALRDADEIISAQAVSRKDALLLGLQEQDPLLRMERITYSISSQPIEFTITDYRSDRYNYRVHLQR